MILFEKVTKKYPNDTVAVRDVTLAIEPSEFVSIVGHSGAGKTTLTKMLLAEERPTSGRVFFGSVDIHRLKKDEIHHFRRKIGTIFQDFRLLPQKTVYENVAFAMEVSGKSDEEIMADVPHVLDLVNLADKAFNFPHELSGGEKQRVAIARAIVNQPDIIIADEPTGNLDPVSTYEIVQILRKINELGTTIILATHNKGVVDSIGRRVLTMEDGVVVRDDPSGKYSM
ncbi:MAG: cell division ATP-binding protein FtsE [Patescibacteria group bacterium]|nr:cell division ATP-binding protein FtsE [Patescibacteria group bacterium]MDE1945610.1 cell division ATP-binding protein FtsE [Patescibacteria group bacterium]